MLFRKSTEDHYLGWHIDWREDYSQFFRDDNWYTYTFCHLEFDNDSILGGIELTAMILGLGFRIRYNHTETEVIKNMLRQIDDLEL